MSKKISRILLIFTCILFSFSKPLTANAADAAAAEYITNASGTFAPASDGSGISSDGEPEYATLNDLEGKIFGCKVGSAQEDMALSKIKDVKLAYYEQTAECLLALSTGKIDATSTTEGVYMSIKDDYPDITAQAEPVASNDVYFGTAKTDFGERLKEEFNEFLASKTETSEYTEFVDSWTKGTIEPTAHDFSTLENVNGCIRFAEAVNSAPFMHVNNNLYYGIEVDLLYEFAGKYGYAVEISSPSFSGVLAGLSTGTYDMTGIVTYKKEREEIINYTNPYYQVNDIILVRKASGAAASSGTNIFTSIGRSFYKNFIEQDRWLMVLKGLKVTVFITFLTIIFGSLLGVLLCAIRRSKFKAAQLLASAFIRLLQGIPMVVLLLIMFYLVFGKVKIDGLYVAVICFSLEFGAYTSEMLRSGIESVGKNQWEAAAILGFSKLQTYRKVIIPQLLPGFIPVYKGQLVSLVKATAIVGYIAVEDLTKVSDIIRSRTYESFFPLITTAIIYLLFAWLLTLIIGKAEKILLNNQANRVLKGIDTGRPRQESGYQSHINKGDNAIEIKSLGKSYGDNFILKDLNAVIRGGDVISLIGPSGCGKSTLLRCISRLEQPTEGEVSVLGTAIKDDRKSLQELHSKIGMVFQTFNLFENMTVIENIMLAPMIVRKVPRQDAYEKALSLLHKVGLDDKALKFPAQLSGGQKQRVAICRALAMEPEIMLFDEPTSALDPTMVNEVQHVIKDLADSGITMLVVTHEMEFAKKISNRVFYMDDKTIYDDGTVEAIFENPTKEKTRRFIKKLSTFNYVIDSPGYDYVNMINEVLAYGARHMIPKKLINKLQYITEELCDRTLSRHFNANDELPLPITYQYEYSEVTGTVEADINYPGAKYNPLEEDTLEIKIVKYQVDNIEYSWEEINKIHILLKA